MNTVGCFTMLLILIALFCLTDNFLFKVQLSQIKIGSFNLHRYSLIKATSNIRVNSYISKIIRRYDLVFLQEIIDSSNENQVVDLLLKYVNKGRRSRKYEAVVSPPLGTTTYKERLVYLYRKRFSKIKILSSYVYNGSMAEMFERQPFILHTKLFSYKEVIFVGVHLKPNKVYQKFRYLRTVVDQFKDNVGIVVLGDFNADCSYLSGRKKRKVRKYYFKEFQWLIADQTETNLLQSCAYDRILVSSGKSRWKKVNWKLKSNQTFLYDEKFKLDKELASKISDHYPVEAIIY